MKLKDILEENIGGLVTIKPLGNMFGEEKSTDLLKIAKGQLQREKLYQKKGLIKWY